MEIENALILHVQLIKYSSVSYKGAEIYIAIVITMDKICKET